MNTLLALLAPVFIIMGFFMRNYTIAISGMFLVGVASMLFPLLDTLPEDNGQTTDSNDEIANMFKSLDKTGQDFNHYLNQINWIAIGEIASAVIVLVGISLFGRFLWKNHRDKKIVCLQNLEKSLHKRLELDSILLLSLKQRGIISETNPSTT